MMFLIVLDLRSNDPLVRKRIEAAVKTLGNWSNRLTNTWLLETKTESARSLRDKLGQFTTETDRLFIARVSKNWAGRNMGAGFPEWLQRREFGTFPND